MKSLKEALLNRPKNIDVARVVAEEYINNNYNIKGKLTFEYINGTYIVNCNGNVEVKNWEIENLTDGFVWGAIKGNFDCSDCEYLKSLEGAPEYVSEEFDCSHCYNLKSLEGAPEKVGGDFSCSWCNNLKSLEGAPEHVGREFRCNDCPNLTSLKGAPEKVKRIDCDRRLKK